MLERQIQAGALWGQESSVGIWYLLRLSVLVMHSGTRKVIIRYDQEPTEPPQAGLGS